MQMLPAARAGFPIAGTCIAVLIFSVLQCSAARAAEPVPQARNLEGYFVSSANAIMTSPMAVGNVRVTGSWVNSTNGPGIFHRGTIYQAPQIAPIGSVVKPTSLVRRVNWRYSFLTPVPNGLRAYLCNYFRCVALSAATGTTAAFNGDSAYSNFSFAFVINGTGSLSPALQGQSNYVAVNYE